MCVCEERKVQVKRRVSHEEGKNKKATEQNFIILLLFYKTLILVIVP